MFEIRTLGGFSLKVDGQAIKDIGSRKAEAILVYLAMEARSLNRNVLKTFLWPESSEEHASTSLRVELSKLKKKFGDYLEINREEVSIKWEARIYLDVTDLQAKLENGEIEQALEIYRGDFLQGFYVRDSAAFEEWLSWEKENIRRIVLSALHELISVSIETGDYLKGLTFSRRLLELNPLDELIHQKTMLLLALDGQRTAALAQYGKCRTTLKEELGAEPSSDTQALYEQVLRGEMPESLGIGVLQHNLPDPQTSFIGREQELAQIGDLVNDSACRLLTLVGPGGIGKTRLALQAAAKARRAFPDGTFFIPMETCYSADYLVPTIANAMKFKIDDSTSTLDPKTQLMDYLRNRMILLVLDSFEHLIDAAGLLSEMLDCAPKVQVIVTSRQRLALKGEWALLVEGLPVHVDKPGAPDAVRLFIERAKQADMDFRLRGADYEHGMRICQLLDGYPLGIELAAAWTSVISTREINEEIEKSLHFLTTTLCDIPEKHRSLQAVFDSSWKLLTKEQCETFCKLSVFQGGFDRQDAMQVAGVNLTQLSALLSKSLLRRDHTGIFAMHSLVKQFAAEKLKELPALQESLYESHCRYYVNLLSHRELDFMGAQMVQARDEVGLKIDNIRAAVDWACLHWEEQPVRKALISLLSFYFLRGWHEGRDAFRDIARLRYEALSSTGLHDTSKDPIILSARTHQAYFLINLGQIDECESISRETLGAIKELELGKELSECLHNLAGSAQMRGEYKIARELLEEAILLGRECGYIIWPTYLLWLGHLYFMIGEYEQGMLTLRKAYELFNKMVCLWGIAFSLSKMGLASDGLGEHSQAMSFNQEALAIFEKVGNQSGMGYTLSRMSMSAYFLEDYPQAVQFGQEGFRIFEEIGHYWGMCVSKCRLGFAYIGLGNIERARNYLKNALQIARERHMLPLSLYALVGLACTLALDGQEQAASKIFLYVKRNPQAATPYLEQAQRWIGNLDQASVSDDIVGVSEDSELESIDGVVGQVLILLGDK